MITPSSIFTQNGVDISADSRNMTYMYGLSDFFSYVFEDTQTLNILLQSTSISASDIYSKFLQLTSTMTLASIQEATSTSIKLAVINSASKQGTKPWYKVKLPLVSAKFLANRAFLPTQILEEGVDFRVKQLDLEYCLIQFARPLSDYQFSYRPLSDGSGEYAVWMVDAVLDEQLMYKYFGAILGIKPAVSSEQFSNLIYGLHYLYLNGPTFKVLEQGLNLILGIPIPRSVGEVLDIRVKVETGQYLVITSSEQYLLPKGIEPAVQIGDIVGLGTALAKWIEIKDFVSDGKWWLNVSIPESIIPARPASQPDRYARAGTRFDELMTKYLCNNTFLVSIRVGDFKANDYFSSINEVLRKAKPAHSQAVYVWNVDMSEESFEGLEELSFSTSQTFGEVRTINSFPINHTYIL